MSDWLVISENADGTAIVHNAIVIADGLTVLKRADLPPDIGPGWKRDSQGVWTAPPPPKLQGNFVLVRLTAGGGAMAIDAVAVDGGELIQRTGELAQLGPGWTRDAAGVWTAPPPPVDPELQTAPPPPADPADSENAEG